MQDTGSFGTGGYGDLGGLGGAAWASNFSGQQSNLEKNSHSFGDGNLGGDYNANANEQQSQQMQQNSQFLQSGGGGVY
jgi:hypothetical protein